MNRYVKVEGHNNWFLVLSKEDLIPDELSEQMQTKMIRSECCKLHDENNSNDVFHRLTMLAVNQLDYKRLVQEYGTILVRPIGSFMLLNDNNIIEEKFDTDFPIDEFGDIVICENDSVAEKFWVDYLKNRFPNSKIITINFFDLRSESEVEKYFEKAKFITFSTTFTNLRWYEKLTKFATHRHKVIGYCDDEEKVKEAMLINSNVEMLRNFK